MIGNVSKTFSNLLYQRLFAICQIQLNWRIIVIKAHFENFPRIRLSYRF